MSRAREIADRDLAGTELILDADNDTSITADTDDTINFKVGGSDRLTINSSGDIDVETGDIFFSGSAKGINLGVTSNTDANTLDDYEEGTWSPGSGVGGITASLATYTKIGRLVHVTCKGVFSNSTNAEEVEVTSLPFAPNIQMTAGSAIWRFLNEAGRHGNAYVKTNSRVVFLSESEDSGFSSLEHSELDDTTNNEVQFHATYHTDS